MKTKKVNRYYCEFCKKSGCSAGHIKKHELHCTMNPNRECGMCLLVENKTIHMSEMLAVIPESYTRKDLSDSITKIRILSNNCPACILAAIRQSGVEPYLFDFSYQQERTNFLSAVNLAEQKKDYESELSADMKNW